MKSTRARSFMVLIMTLVFFAGLAYYTVKLIMHSAEWASMPMNAHISDTDGLAFAGNIYDRNNVILAQSIDKKRVYNDDEKIRKACVHIIGDNSTNISTAVQTIYRSELTDFNFIHGLGAPDMLKQGRDITLTIDSELQKTALDALGGHKGAVICYDYKTGEILCMVSTPTYDPVSVPDDIETNGRYDGAYLNRAISVCYPPGSTFKLVTASAALAEYPEAERFTYECKGKETIGGGEMVCYTTSGDVDLKNALADSCNIYFGHLALYLGKEKMTEYAEKAGFNNYMMIDRAQSERSFYNVENADDNDLAWSGVGQYTVMETPVNMARMSAAIANGGVPVKPYFIKYMEGTLGISGKYGETELDERIMEKDTAEALKKLMDYTVTKTYGKSYVSTKLDICGKTGTAEVDGAPAHAWFTGFSTNEECPIAFAVIIENGDSAYNVAIPAARAVLDKAAEIYKP